MPIENSQPAHQIKKDELCCSILIFSVMLSFNLKNRNRSIWAEIKKWVTGVTHKGNEQMVVLGGGGCIAERLRALIEEPVGCRIVAVPDSYA